MIRLTGTRQFALVVLILTVLILAMQGVWGVREHLPEVTTVPVTVADIENSVLATGTINAETLINVGAQVSGEVKRLYVGLGDKVKKGQVIAEIDSLTQQNDLRNAHAALLSVQAQKQAKLLGLNQADLNLVRQRALVSQDIVSRSDLELAETTSGTLRAEIVALDAQIEQALLTEDTARHNLSYTRINAPMDGVIVAVVTEQGQTVNSNQAAPTIVKLARTSTMRVKAQISEADVLNVEPGMPSYLVLLGEPDLRYEAKLIGVEPGPTTMSTDSNTGSSTTANSLEKAIYYNGIFDLPNPQGKLRIGMTAQIQIILQRAKDALIIPCAALGRHDENGLYEVRVLAGTQTKTKKVKIGINNHVHAQIIEGLNAGELVVTGEMAAGHAGARRQGSGRSVF